ncbi:hypothetical protein, partial [Segatella sp.]|uniref:hypothetical protein n=1 Tax=Segatella sp. TaxID=2974253 RepID=UPI003AB01D46
ERLFIPWLCGRQGVVECFSINFEKSCLTSKHMHIAEIRTITKLLPQVALWGKGILCLRHFCCARNMYNKMNFVALQAKSH